MPQKYPYPLSQRPTRSCFALFPGWLTGANREKKRRREEEKKKKKRREEKKQRRREEKKQRRREEDTKPATCGTRTVHCYAKGVLFTDRA
ncbi:MAG TPA: hypothetical protein PKD45_00995 [Flavobacteriales bacterium]|nr:hypothetical protein [Flavobacteriales bacterium]